MALKTSYEAMSFGARLQPTGRKANLYLAHISQIDFEVTEISTVL
jgi:hypothetical protein